MSSPTCKAWMGLHPQMAATARVCAHCPDKAEADTWAEAQGLRISHGICDPCAEVFMGRPRGTVPVAVKARQVARDVTAKTFDAGTDRASDPAAAPLLAPEAGAAASTPPAAAACVVSYVNAEEVAKVCRLTAYKLHEYKPAHWGVPRDWKFYGRSTLYNVAALPELADELAERGQVDAAAALCSWWRIRQNDSPPAPRPAAPAALPLWFQKGQFE